MPYTIAIIVGSLRKDSFNRKLGNALTKLAPPTLQLSMLEIADLPFFNQDLEATPPQQWVDFRNKVKAVDGVLFITPEYNRSMPAVLKNAIDVASRPYGQSVWNGKPAGVISGSVGAQGGFGANHHLRQSLVFLNMPAMQQPEAYFGGLGDCFDAAGNITNPKTTELLQTYVAAYAKWVETIVKK